MKELFRSIPSIDICLRALCNAEKEFEKLPQALLRNIAANFWEKKRKDIINKIITEKKDLFLEAVLPDMITEVRNAFKPVLRRVLNGTGVIIHTNLGRSVLSPDAVKAVNMAAKNYCNLEMDMATGERGSRHLVIEHLLCRLTGAEAAIAVNNNAAAVLLMLDTISSDGEAIVSRGELVEIGGSFRIPDIMEKSGTVLREAGTTNRTHLKDYKNAINEKTKAIMRVHTSNFRVIGFHSSVDLHELKKLAAENGLPLLFDLGSGSLLDFSEYGLPMEPTVAQVLAEGADCVCFSGDKALGGPQAGIIAGKKEIVDRLKKNPLLRALRCDKLCLAALEATLRQYLEPEKARQFVPTPGMICKSEAVIAKDAKSLAARIRAALLKAGITCDVTLKKDVSRVGGGTFPECNLPTMLVCLQPFCCTAQQLKDALLNTSPPLIGRLEKDAFCLDPRTLDKADYGEAAKVIADALCFLQGIIIT